MHRALLAVALLLGAAAPFAAEPPETTFVVDLRNLPSLQSMMPQLAERRVVFVGEIHDEYAHHLNQLAIIRGLHEHHGDNLVIGLEFFQQPFQAALDDYVAGRIDEAEMLRRSEYFERWRYDYRLYRPILTYAREQGIPLLALNVPAEWNQAVGSGGVDSLPEADRAKLPELDRSNEAYVARIRQAFDMHPARDGRTFENFLDSQLLWDEGMAARAADYLREHPKAHMVLLAGGGHLAYGDGIPDRLTRRIDVSRAIVLNEAAGELSPAIADFVLLPKRKTLPPKGLLGVFMATADSGVRVEGLPEESAAKAAGVRKEDRIVALNGQPITCTTDLLLALLDKPPGEQVGVSVVRADWLGKEKRLEYAVTLQ